MQFTRRADRLTRDLDRLRRRLPARRVPVPESPAKLAEAVGLELDDWQQSYLESRSDRRLLLCSRQAGKSTTAALDALHDALTVPGALVLLVAPSERQSVELMRKAGGMYANLGYPVGATSDRKTGLELVNGSRLEAIPSTERSIRGFSAPRRIVVDEASRVLEETFVALLPMLARSGGSMDLLSTPAGRRGFFYDAHRSGTWETRTVRATDIPHRITPEFLEDMAASMDRRMFEQEFMCEFLDADDATFSAELLEGAAGHEVDDVGGFDWHGHAA
jgi:hypothetical protein